MNIADNNSEAPYVVRQLSREDAPAAAHAWNELADGPLSPETVRPIEVLLARTLATTSRRSAQTQKASSVASRRRVSSGTR